MLGADLAAAPKMETKRPTDILSGQQFVDELVDFGTDAF